MAFHTADAAGTAKAKSPRSDLERENMTSFKERMAAAKDSMVNAYKESAAEEKAKREPKAAEEEAKRETLILQLTSVKGVLRLYPDFIEWKLGIGVADDVQRILYSEVNSVSMGGSIAPPGGVAATFLSAGMNVVMAPKQKSITLNVAGVAHTFKFNMETTEKVREAVDFITRKSFEAKKKPTQAPNAPSAADEIAKLAALHRDGVLTDEEFTSAKAKLLGAG